ncbi:hypothetical protein K431DRAFT_231619 [Polychaeton citri CBS 116435]|uniref:tRNA/rRNA methyltransferase SpoU type domain-containing protein n=1 Tax=Polychaeton citri CBS 116435 TaxID=1314669 RepID=A0A9P4UMM5_9PEZI|nr:hypothetical protein K431DRAFT_231619 [Polychaeton citri CBS 116435]
METGNTTSERGGLTTATLLLQHVNEDERPPLIRGIAKSSSLETASDTSFVTSILSRYPDEDAEFEVARRLKASIDRGLIDEWVPGIKAHKVISLRLLELSTATLKESLDSLSALPKSQGISVPLEPNIRHEIEAHCAEQRRASEASSVILLARSHLSFIQKVFVDAKDRETSTHPDLYNTVLSLMGAADPSISASAANVCFSLLRVPGSLRHALLWTRIATLVAVKHSPSHVTIGYQLWLRALINGDLDDQITEHQVTYWTLINGGLRHGDTERRKLCLQILRHSVERGMQPIDSRLAAGLPKFKVEMLLKHQYDRYCVVFETIILGRYINQVHECRRDLDALVSNGSVIGEAWILTLVESAMNPSVQENIRKFMGLWVMNAGDLFTSMPTSAATILKQSILPWATQGALFISTVREKEGRMQCFYGEQLAKYIESTLTSEHHSAEVTTSVINAILACIKDNQNTLFPLAVVYLVEAIARAFNRRDGLFLNNAQFQVLMELAFWSKYSDITRDFVRVTVLSIGKISLQGNGSIEEELSSATKVRWDGLQEECAQLIQGTANSITLRGMSARAVKEQDSLRKSRTFHTALDTAPREYTSEQLYMHLEDLINDLEYLEYPKNVLMAFIRIVLHDHVLEVVLDSPESPLALMVIDLVRQFQSFCENRIYLLALFLINLRRAILKDQRLVQLLSLEDIIVQFTEFPPQAKIEYLMEDVVAQLLSPKTQGKLSYEHYYGKRHAIGFAALVDICSRLGSLEPTAVKRIIDRLLQKWIDQKPPAPTYCKWKTTLQLQVVFLLNEQILWTGNKIMAKEILETCHKVLAMEQLPRLRHLLEWMIVRIYLLDSSLRNDIFDQLATKDHHSNPKYLASLMKIAVITSRSEPCDEAFANEVATAIVPLSASSKVIVRHEAQWSFPTLMKHAKARNWTSITKSAALVALDKYIKSLSRWNDPPLERELDRLDPDRDHNLTHLVEGGYIALEPIERPLTTNRDLAELYAEHDLKGDIAHPSCMPLGDPIKTRAEEAIALSLEKGSHLRQKSAEPIKTDSAASSGDLALQTKGTAYLSAFLDDPSSESENTRRNDLMVVASLIDNPYNLGGLSRASEIFGASALYLENPSVTSNKLFTSVSVASHLHLPLLPLAAPDLQAFLAGKKTEGWAIVGIEQTDRSVLLGSAACEIPQKTILVLGSEREGVPALVLSECDLLVEIPQQGITRSLNVQTAASIVLFEYTRQHRGGI